MTEPRPVIVPRPIIRETILARIAFAYGAFFSVALAACIATWGASATSPQWRYLMESLGGHWQWSGVFASAAVLTLYGVVRTCWWCVTLGLLMTAFGCLLIAFIYLVAPVFDNGLFTLGWFPWMVGCSSVHLFLAVTASRPFEVM